MPVGLERPLQRLPDGCGRRRLVAKPLQELDDEGRRQAAPTPELHGEETIHLLRRKERMPGQQALQSLGLNATAARGHHAVGEPAQFLDERQAQHDRHRPRFADGQRGDALIGDGEIDERVEIEPAGRVRDEFARDDIHTRRVRERADRPASGAPRRSSSAGPAGPRGPGPARGGSCRAASPRIAPAVRRLDLLPTGTDRFLQGDRRSRRGVGGDARPGPDATRGDGCAPERLRAPRAALA